MNPMLHYPLSGPCPGVCSSFGYEEQLSDHFYQRLIDSFRVSDAIARTLCRMEAGDIWNDGFVSTQRAPIHALLRTESRIGRWREVFSHPLEHDLFYGFDSTARGFSDGVAVLPEAGLDIIDRLLRLAEALGARMWNPESRQDLHLPDIDALMDRLEARLGFPLFFPAPYPGMAGISTCRGLLRNRALWGLYLAWRASLFSPKKVLEIGAGLGYAAYYGSGFGIQEYTIIDIPLTLVASSHFLALMKGEENIQLCNEYERMPATNVEKNENCTFYKMKHPYSILRDSQKYDIIINMDSLTEMGYATAKSYAEYIIRSSKRFLSINHEVNSCTVRELFENDPRVTSCIRYPFWMRRGYVEEIYEFS